MALASGFNAGSRSGTPPLEVTLKRGCISESMHRVHAVVCDGRGRVLMCAGDPGFETFIRSALKPFQALPFISSGAAAHPDCFSAMAEGVLKPQSHDLARIAVAPFGK